MKLKAIGTVHSSFEERGEAPPQSEEEISKIEIYEKYERGLKDIEGFSHLHVFYWLHKSEESPLSVVTPWNSESHGVFATRSPGRPNQIAHSVVELMERDGRFLKVKGLDAIEKTPIIDIKPYFPRIDSKPDAKIGWLKKTRK